MEYIQSYVKRRGDDRGEASIVDFSIPYTLPAYKAAAQQYGWDNIIISTPLTDDFKLYIDKLLKDNDKDVVNKAKRVVEQINRLSSFPVPRNNGITSPPESDGGDGAVGEGEVTGNE
jgi:hypothetical protein